MYGMCTDISVCASVANYAPPQPSTAPLYKYLQSQSTTYVTPIQAITQVESLLKQKQCYTYAIRTDPKLYAYNNLTQSFKIPTNASYEYNERSLLQSTNIGYFGFGISTKSDYYTMTYSVPTNYNYM